MSIGIGDNLGKSFEFAKNRLFGKWVDWIILIVLTLLIMAGALIPVVGIIVMLVASLLLTGFIIRVYRSTDAKLDDYVKMFIDGILATIITFIYMIVPIIVAVIFGVAAIISSVSLLGPESVMNPMETINGLAAGIGIIGIIVTVIVTIIFAIMATMALVRFAKEESFGAAFQFGEIFKIIGKIGWLHYILSWIVLMIIFSVIILIFALLSIIVIGLVLMLVFLPFLFIWEARYFAQLYESA